MNGVLFITGLLPVLIVVIVGLAIKYKKAYWLISGYNMMSEEKKKNVDFEGLGNFIASICFAIAGIILIASVLINADKASFALIAYMLLIPVVIFAVIRAQKYDGNTKNKDGSMKFRSKVMVGIIVGFLVLVMAGVSALIYYSSKPAEFALNDGVLKISGMYGREIPVKEINSINIKDELPEILAKTNGSALGTKCKGYFTLKDLGGVELFADTSISPYIYLDTDFKPIILNCESSGETHALFDKLKEEWLKVR